MRHRLLFWGKILAFSVDINSWTGSSVSSITLASYAVSAGANKIMAVGVGMRGTATIATISSVQHNAVSLTSRASHKISADGGREIQADLYDLQLGSTTPSGDLVVTLSVAEDGVSGNVQISAGLAQQAPEATNTNDVTTSANGIDSTITTVTSGAEIVDCVVCDRNTGTQAVANGPDQVENTDTADAVMVGSSRRTGGGAGSHAMGWDDDNPGRTSKWTHALAAYQLVAAGGGPRGPLGHPLFGCFGGPL